MKAGHNAEYVFVRPVEGLLLAESRRSNLAAYAPQAANVLCNPFSEATPI